MIPDETILLRFADYIKNKKLRMTKQRKIILSVFLKSAGHISMEDLYIKAKELDESIGQVTVYRNLKLFCECGIATPVNFEEGMIRYERSDSLHHDHLVCERCGEKIEFVDHGIEEKQKELAKNFGFQLTTHHMILYGICPKCLAKEGFSKE